MTAPFLNLKVLAWVTALVLTAALVSIGLDRPKQVADTVLGGEWQCSRTAFLTSCTRIAPKPALHSVRPNPITRWQV
jgi:hypothetical protein